MLKNSESAIKNLLERGTGEVIIKEHLEAELKAGKKLRVKFGIDPTAQDLHLGHAVVFRKLKQFQDIGHQIVLIIGDYTARIGDPSLKSKTRPMLTEKEIDINSQTYLDQIGKFLDVSKIEIRKNSEWFSGNQSWALEVSGMFSVQRLLERDDFSKRLKSGVEVTLRELLYPTMQAYDSVKISADVELGGTDQKFNMLAGRDLQRHMGMKEQDVITLPLLRGLDGVHKMSKSLGNYVGITEDANTMFGKIMSVPDELINEYYTLCTDAERIFSDPREAKLELGKIIVDMYHGAHAGEAAKEEFVKVFSKKGAPSEIKKSKIKNRNIRLVDLLVETKMAPSKSEARRLIKQGGVKIDEVKRLEPEAEIDLTKERLLQVGPRKFLMVSGE
jgi:tyrosyl-tRNA synthetase